MLANKPKAALIALLVALALGAGGTVLRSAGSGAYAADSLQPKNELETIRHENELLKLNLQVVLEKVRAQEAELRALKQAGKQATSSIPKVEALAFLPDGTLVADTQEAMILFATKDPNTKEAKLDIGRLYHDDCLRRAEAALKKLREARTEEARAKAQKELEEAVKGMKSSGYRLPSSKGYFDPPRFYPLVGWAQLFHPE